MVLFRTLIVCLVCASAAPVFGQVQAPAPPVPAASADALFDACSRHTQWRLEVVTANHMRLTGQVHIECPQMAFFADVIDIYTDPDLRLVATGNVVFTNPEGRLAAERVEFNVATGTGTFHQASGILSLGETADRTLFAGQEPDVYFYGETIEKIDNRSYRLTRGGFTTCVQPTPRWEVTSDSVVINLNDYAVARNMLLRVKGVPLMYLPIIYYPIQGDDRATGFLLPSYGTSSLRGQALSNAFFWALGRSQDATFFHDWFTQAGQGAGAEYRYVAGQGSYGDFRFYRFEQQETEFRRSGTSSILPAQSSYQITGSGVQTLGTAVRTHQRIDYTTSLITKQLYQQDIYQASNASRTVEAGVSGTWGGLNTSALYQRIETSTGDDTSQLYGSTPRVTATVAPQRLFGSQIYGSVNSEYAYLPFRALRGDEVTSDQSLGRLDLQPRVQAALSRLTFLSVNTTASYRTTYYTRNAATTEPLVRQYLTQQTDIVGPVVARIWDTPASGYSERMKHVIEPTFSLDYVTEIGNYQEVPILSDSSDRVVGGSMRFTYGVTNRLFFRARTTDASAGQTVQALTVGIQQTYYGSPLASQTDTRYTSAAYHRTPADLSAVAIVVRATPSAALDSSTRLEYDVHGQGLQVFTTGTTARLGPSSASVSYSRLRASQTATADSSLSTSTSLNFLQGRATGAYGLTWDIGRSALLNQRVAVAYMAQCCGIQAEFQKFKYPQANPNFPIPSDQRFNVSFVLAGLGTFSNFFGAFGGLMGQGY